MELLAQPVGSNQLISSFNTNTTGPAGQQLNAVDLANRNSFRMGRPKVNSPGGPGSFIASNLIKSQNNVFEGAHGPLLKSSQQQVGAS